ncbi:hypothetical protein NESM_000642000 [Novymonas esmeraldas]|uniref:Uncharacterized protein n=1 Tax=Novymonas esmeraldas TaxID=1808958 RepID=A0AAW0ETX6_9TRYP
MLNLLLELVLSVAVCAALAYFAFLSAPAETEEPESPTFTRGPPSTAATAGQEYPGDGAAAGQPGHDPILLRPHELPLYTVIDRHVSLAEDAVLGVAYRWILINGLHYSPRELYSEPPLREWGREPLGCAGHPRAGDDGAAAEAGPSSSSSVAAGGAGRAVDASRRSRRRLRRGPAAVAAAPPTPLRRESVHWVNVLLRCAAFLTLGGGTVRPEVWTDRLMYAAERASSGVNAGYDRRARARAAEMRAAAAQLASAAAQQTPLGRQSSSPSSSPPPLLAPRKQLLRVQLLELGSGLLGGPPRDARRPPLPARGLGDTTGAATTSGAAYAPVSMASLGTATTSSTGDAGAGSFLMSSTATLSFAADADGARVPDTILSAPASDLGGGGGGGGAHLGVVLPRVEGDVVSVEVPYGGGGCGSPGAVPLRTFTVPLHYEDQRFHVRLGCCLPLGAVLPISLCVPPDVLTLDCAVSVRRLLFSGHLHAAFHGTRVELCFPTAPLFTAAVGAMPDAGSAGAGGSGAAAGAATDGSHYHGWGSRTAAAAAATAAAAPATTRAFTATYTTRNEASAVGGASADTWRDPRGAAARPPLPPLSGHFNNNSGGGGGGASCVYEGNEKVQEVVLLAVRRLVESITYPNVLAAELVCSGSRDPSGGAAARHFDLRWTRQTATLPLRM